MHELFPAKALDTRSRDGAEVGCVVDDLDTSARPRSEHGVTTLAVNAVLTPISSLRPFIEYAPEHEIDLYFEWRHTHTAAALRKKTPLAFKDIAAEIMVNSQSLQDTVSTCSELANTSATHFLGPEAVSRKHFRHRSVAPSPCA
ncbi:hypothetical protein AK812_SmicGene20492 [Symbiodinium microadriaticum]|uniref:Uncharacterized protein n=1 Tax=Symbiodinium microadriaticum TaxID=2951 RepID=A0A1Q9DPS8_SYMMI|nr:hypothetical protein AK812_SmicGene20492 [Symbiodinium microadriaticum]